MHHLPRQFFGGKVHLFGDTVQFNSSVFLEAEAGLIAFTILKRLVREAKPAACYAEGDFVCADLYDCVMPAVESVGGGIRAKQRCPGSPKFSSEARIQHQRLAVNFAEDNIDRSDDGDDIGEEATFTHGFKRLQRRIGRIPHMHSVRLGGAVGDDVVTHFTAW
jgi:hypothetical protein